MSVSDRSTPLLRAVRTEAKCPVCGRPAEAQYKPFCTKRCADIDLGRWLKESYRIPADEVGDDDASPSEREGRPETT